MSDGNYSELAPGVVTDEAGTIYYRNEEDRLHREDGPAVIYLDGTKCWYLNGERHRLDGPAIEWVNGDKDWYFHGIRHRDDGPAFEASNGYKEWCINGNELSEEEFNSYLAKRKLNELLQSNLQEREPKMQSKI